MKELVEDPVFMKAETLLHRLWGKAVGAEDYNKAEWLELQKRIQNFASQTEDLQVGCVGCDMKIDVAWAVEHNGKCYVCEGKGDD